MTPRTYTAEEAAVEYGCSPATARKHYQRLGGFKIGKTVRFDCEKVAGIKSSSPDILRRPVKTITDLAAAVDALTLLCREREQQAERDRAEIERLKKIINP